MSNLTVFDFESNNVRVVSVQGEPWFVARDVLKAIRSSTTVSAVEALIREELGEEFVTNQPLLTKGGTQSMLLLSEPATSLVIARSRTEWGKRMNRWIHVEILPAIRKTGSYNPNPEPLRQLPSAIEYLEAIKQLPDITNPILKAALEQRFAEELGVSNALAPRTSVPVLAAVLARELGFDLKPGEDAKLGKWVRKHHEPIGKAQHGRYTVCIYEREEIEPTIRRYFDRAKLTVASR